MAAEKLTDLEDELNRSDSGSSCNNVIAHLLLCFVVGTSRTGVCQEQVGQGRGPHVGAPLNCHREQEVRKRVPWGRGRPCVLPGWPSLAGADSPSLRGLGSKRGLLDQQP